MILTCPECATAYFVDDDRFGPGGRTVRCSSCAATWFAERKSEPALELTPVADVAIPAKTALSPPAPEPNAKPGGEALSLRAQAQAKRKTRQAATAGVVWAMLAAGFVLVVLGAVIFRVQVVKLWPSTAGAYAFAKMPVNPTGFAIEELQGGPALIDGRLAMVVTGVQRNVRDDARAAQPLRVSLFDKGGRALVSQVVAPSSAPVGPGEARAFKVSFLDPPTASDAGAEFAFDVKRPAPAVARRPAPHPALVAAPPHPIAVNVPAAVQAAPAPLLRGREEAEAVPFNPATVQAAKPLPADSPYALPDRPHG